jgi:hypothetical protein
VAFAALMLAQAGAFAADAAAFDVARLMQLLAQTKEAQFPYVERKYSDLLAEPLVSSGTLLWRRPGLVEKNMVAPRAERFRIDGDELIVTRKDAQKRYPLASQPLLAAFAASLRGMLGGDLALLREHYSVALQGTESDWHVDLVPLDDEMKRYVARIRVGGQAGKVAEIEIREAGGDRSVLQVR